MLKKKVWKPLAGAFSLLALISTAVFVFSLLRVDVLPGKYLFALLALEAAALLAAVLLLYAGMRKKRSPARRARRVIGVLLAVLLTAGNAFAAALLLDLNDLKTAVTGRREKQIPIGVYVLSDDAAQTLADTALYRYGVLGGFEKGHSERALSEIEGELGTAVDAAEYAAIADVFTALRDGEIRALAVNENYLDLLSESESLGGFSEKLRLICRFEVPQSAASSGREDAMGPDGKTGGSGSSGAGALIDSLLGRKSASDGALTLSEKIERNKCFILYLSGSDSRSSLESSGRSDVNILMVVDPGTDQILLVNTPRDYYLPNPALGGGMDKLTHCGLFGADNSMAALEELYGIEIDNYCQINFTGFEKLIDAIGGITLDNPRAFTSGSGFYFPQGVISLNGEEALSYGREREAFGDGDLARGRNLMRLIDAMIDKAKHEGASLVMNYSSVLSSLEGMFATDLSEAELSALVKLAIRDLSGWEVKSVGVSGSGGMMRTAAGGDVPLYVMWPDGDDVARASALIGKLMAGQIVSENELG